MRVDVWKISSGALVVALACVVAGRQVREAEAKPVPVPIPSHTDKKKAPPAAQATKVLETARTALNKVPGDIEGHKAKALAQIQTALNETKVLGAGEDEEGGN